jgi:mono/diheme cytochrome c family protein
VSCHIRPGGQPFAGGYGVNTPFGIIYGSNITPDPKTGIGGWSLEAFTRAMREGVSRDGSHLFAAFPFNAYTELQDDDVKALYAYLMTRPAISATVPPMTVPFPLNVRFLQEGWKILCFRSGRYRPDPAKDAQWNRGAYLAQAVSDCGGCHTPRNALGGEKLRDAYTGTVVDNWIAPPLTEANPIARPVDARRVVQLPAHRSRSTARSGRRHDDSDHPRRPGPSRLSRIAMFAPSRSISATSTTQARVSLTSKQQRREALQNSSLGSGQEYDPDANLYASACLSCHYNTGRVPLPARPELALNSALSLPEPTNFIQAVLRGIGNTEGAPGLVMPAYASSFTDAEVARLAAYLRRTRTTRPPWTDLENKVSAVRRELTASH